MGQAKQRRLNNWLPVAEPSGRKPGWWQVPPRTDKEFIIDMVRCLEERAVRCEVLANRRHCTPERRAKLLKKHWRAKADIKIWRSVVET